MTKAISLSTLAGLSLLCINLQTLAFSHDTSLELGCSAGELRGATLINPVNLPLEDVYGDTCQLALGGDLLATRGNWELQVSGWAEQWYGEDAAGKDYEDLRWRWQSSHLRWSGDQLQLSLGVSNYEQGPGYAWNPINPFFDIRLNERDAAIPYRRDADPMASASWSDDHGLWRFIAMDHEVFPRDYVDHGSDRYSYLLTREQLFASSQLTVNIASLEGKPFAGLAYEWTASDALELHAEVSWREGRKIPGFTSIEVMPGAWLANYDIARDDEYYLNGLVGLQYSFSNNINLIVEYYYQDDAYSESDWNHLTTQLQQQHHQWQYGLLPDASLGFLLTTHQWLRLLHRDYAFARLAIPDVWNDGELSLFARHDLVDSSLIAGALFNKPLGDRIDLKLSFQIADGAEVSEGYWIPREHEFTAALQYHF
ncbi:MAG TPA: hypothetical protein VL995_18620 [Cellvibrio sp.]|nr:hypothetical protein [Cellvibrio sp.]